MWFFDLGYLGLFLACFLSATIIPFTSEGILLLFLTAGFNPIHCLIVSTLGNTLGSVLNYLLGLIGHPNSIQRLFKSEKRKEQFLFWINRYGAAVGLLAWVPIIGDPLTIALGFFRTHFATTLLFILIGKFLRYSLIIAFW